jgi:hypothetical protein
LKADDTEGWIPISVPAASAMFFDPMTGKSGKARLRQTDGYTEVYMQLTSGQSIILKTFTKTDVEVPAWEYWKPQGESLATDSIWDIHFVQSEPQIGKTFSSALGSWTALDAPEAKINMGTACYATNFTLKDETAKEWMLDLGDVRESARVRVNGKEVATLWSVPFRCLVGKYLRQGENRIEVEVTNLPANRIAEMDRQEIPWRKFKEINFVDINYKKTGYGHWEPVLSGLLGPVKLIPMQAD